MGTVGSVDGYGFEAVHTSGPRKDGVAGLRVTSYSLTEAPTTRRWIGGLMERMMVNNNKFSPEPFQESNATSLVFIGDLVNPLAPRQDIPKM